MYGKTTGSISGGGFFFGLAGYMACRSLLGLGHGLSVVFSEQGVGFGGLLGFLVFDLEYWKI